MSREWKPGDVALSLGERVVCTDGMWIWATTGRTCLSQGTVTAHARPLVVIDPEDREQVERLILALPDATDWGFANSDDCDNPDSLAVVEGIVEPFQNALRKFANPTQPKPEQPGLYSVVEDSSGNEWCRIDAASEGFCWQLLGQPAIGRQTYGTWDDIAAVRVLSEGVTP